MLKVRRRFFFIFFLVAVLFLSYKCESINIPYFFLKNMGQFQKSVSYNLKTPTSNIFFLKDRFVYQFVKKETKDPSDTTPAQYENIEVKFINPSGKMFFSEENQLQSKTNYLIGNEKEKWITDIPNFQTLVYNNIYQGIDLKYYSEHNELKYDLIVQPDGDIEDIKLEFNGQQHIELKNGKLEISTTSKKLIEHIPLAYQIINGKKVIVNVKYRLTNNCVGFSCASYNKSAPLIIDPILFYATYVGGNGDDLYLVGNIQKDKSGNIYTAGYTSSTNFPATAGALQSSYGGGNYDAFVFKLNSAGTNLIYSTYIGGADFDRINSILLDSNTNELYVCGGSWSPTFPTTTGAYQTVLASSGVAGDGFFLKLSATGNNLLFSTFIGGSDDDITLAMVLDTQGYIWFTGQSKSSNFPVTTGAYDVSWNGDYDCTIFKMDNLGKTLLYSTFLGGPLREAGTSIILDNNNNVYVSVHTAGSFPTTLGAFDVTYNGGIYDIAVSKLNSTISSLIYSTYLGGSGDDAITNDIHVDNIGNILCSGYGSSGFPTTVGAYNATYNGGNTDGFVIELNSSGTALNFSTLIGSTGDDGAHMSYKDHNNNIVVTGYCNNNFPVTPCCYDPTYNGGNSDAFISIFNPSCSSLIYSTYIGGSGNDAGWALTCDYDTVYVTGNTGSSNFPTTTGAYDASFNGGTSDFFVLKIYLDIQPAVSAFNLVNNPCSMSCSFTNLSVDANTYTWLFGDGNTSSLTSPSYTYNAAGQYTISLIASSAIGCKDTSQQIITINVVPQLQFTITPNNCNNSMTINNTSGNVSAFEWYFGDSQQSNAQNPNHIYSSAGTYSVVLIASSSNGCTDTLEKTIVLQNVTPVAIFMVSSTGCVGDFSFTNSSTNANSYTWNFGDGTSISIQQFPIHDYTSAGTYTTQLIAVNQTCNSYDTSYQTIQVLSKPLVNLGKDTSVCTSGGVAFVLNAGNPGALYQWNTGSTAQTISITSSGTYSVVVTKSGCSNSDAININSPNFEFGTDTTFCGKENMELKPEKLNITPDNYLWSTGENTPTISVTEEGTYWLQISEGNCVVKDYIYITGGYESGTLWIPNTFTPNNDRLNETFKPIGTDILQFDMKIYNLWGEKIFETTDYNIGWDGMYKGQVAEMATYVWLINYTTSCSKNFPIRKSGQVNLID
jgi:gliding motility-associated-like protein